LQRIEAGFSALPFDDEAARAYGRVYAAVAASGRKPRRARTLDLLIVAVACAQDLPLYTRNSGDFSSFEHVVRIVAV
jgi:predicted nucleic acid-binding protein